VRNLLTTSVDLFASGYDPSRAKAFQDEFIDRIEAIPGVEAAALSRLTPFSYRTYSSAAIVIDGYIPPPDQQLTIEYNEISPEFLAIIGIPLAAGRDFTRADDEGGPPVAIVDETMARQFWPRQDAVGRRIQLKGQWLQVVGIRSVSISRQRPGCTYGPRQVLRRSHRRSFGRSTGSTPASRHRS
jgi:putative ABC transport system permease protein